MNKLNYFFIMCLLLCGLAACNSNKAIGITPSSSSLILGKWNLEQQKTLQYVNGVVQIDTTFTASVSVNARAQFNADGTYNSASHYVAQTGPPLTFGNGSIAAANDSTFGTYNIADTQLKLSSIVTGFISATLAYGTTTFQSTLPTFALVSNISQINSLSSSKLNIHSEVIYSSSLNNTTTTYKNEFDYYYTK